MTTLFEVLKPEAQNELVRDHVIDILKIIARAVPDPDRPDDRLAMKIAAEVVHAFAPGQAEIDAELARIRDICSGAGEDISIAMQDTLLVALNRRRRELDGLRDGKIGGRPAAYLADPQVREFIQPILRSAKADVTVWCLTWTVAMDDDGTLLVDCEDSFTDPDSATAVVNFYNHSIYAEDRDNETQEKVKQRMRRVNDIVGRLTRGLMEGEAFTA